MTKKFIEMTRSEAVNFIQDFAEKHFQKSNKEGVVFDLIYKWNDANPDELEIFGCDYVEDGFMNNNVVGVWVEYDWYIFADYREEYDEFISNK